MLFNLLAPLAEDFGPLNLFRYITFRTGAAVVTALVVCFIFGPVLIRWLRSQQSDGQPIREDGPEHHLLKKQGTPTMGGFLILLGLGLGTLLWADLGNHYVWATLLVTMGFGAIGFTDDYLKVTRSHHRGLPGWIKLLLEVGVAAIATVWIMSLSREPLATGLALPFVKDVLLNLGWLFAPLAVFVIVGASNSVNLTDGLDGLAIVPVMIAASAFALISYFVGNAVFSDYLQLHNVAGAGELAVFCGALVGASLGFLLVQRAPRHGVHGRHREPGVGRGAGRRRGHHQARTGAGYRWRSVRPRNRLGNRSGHLLSTHRPPRLPHGAIAPSFRAKRMGGADHRDSLLDHRTGAGADRARVSEAPVMR